MIDLEARLTRHFDRTASAPTPGNVAAVMRAGAVRRRRHKTVVSITTVTVVALLVVGLGVVVSGDRHRTIDPTRPIVPPAGGNVLPQAVAGDVPISWSLVDTPRTGLPMTSCCGTIQSSGVYSLSTATGANGDVVQELQRTNDGVTFAPVAAAPANLWISRLSDSGDGHIYALATAPGQSGYNLSAVSSNDGGSTWQHQQLPIDTASIVAQLGGAGWYGQAVAGGGGHAVAAASPLSLDRQGVAGLDAPYGYAATADSLEVYAAPDLNALRPQLCVGDAVITQTDAVTTTIGVATDGETVATAAPTSIPDPATATTLPPDQLKTWLCTDPTHPDQTTYIDPGLLHGPVDHVVPYAQLGLSADTVKALRRQARVFRIDDTDTWTEINLPREVQLNATGPTLLRWFGDHFVLILSTPDGLAVFTSSDGATWNEGQGLPNLGEAQLAQLPNGDMLVVGRSGAQIAAYTSVDGSSWKGVAIDALVANPAIRVLSFQLVGGSAGAAVVLNVQQDPVAEHGGVTVSHDQYTLRLPRTGDLYQVLDQSGNVLATMGDAPNTSQTGVRLEQRSDGGLLVIDATGAVADTFRQGEVDAMYTLTVTTTPGIAITAETAPADTSNEDPATIASTIPVSQDGQLAGGTWTVTTIDGTTWKAEPVPGISPFTSNMRPGNASNGILAVPFARNDGIAAQVLLGTPTR